MHRAVTAFTILLLIYPPAQAGKAVINADQVLEIDGRKTFLIGFMMPPQPDAGTPWGKGGIEEVAGAGATFLRTGIIGQGAEWDDAAFEREQKWQDAAAKYRMNCLIGLRQAGSVNNPQK